MIVEGRGMKSAILETVLSRRNILRITDCHLLTSVPGKFDRFSEFTGDGSLKATFPEQGVYCLDLIPVLFLSNLRQVCGCTFDAFFIDEFNSNPMDPYPNPNATRDAEFQMRLFSPPSPGNHWHPQS